MMCSTPLNARLLGTSLWYVLSGVATRRTFFNFNMTVITDDSHQAPLLCTVTRGMARPISRAHATSNCERRLDVD